MQATIITLDVLNSGGDLSYILEMVTFNHNFLHHHHHQHACSDVSTVWLQLHLMLIVVESFSFNVYLSANKVTTLVALDCTSLALWHFK